MVSDGQIVVREMMTLSLTADHQVIEDDTYLGESLKQVGDDMRVDGAWVKPDDVVFFRRVLPDPMDGQPAHVHGFERVCGPAEGAKAHADDPSVAGVCEPVDVRAWVVAVRRHQTDAEKAVRVLTQAAQQVGMMLEGGATDLYQDGAVDAVRLHALEEQLHRRLTLSGQMVTHLAGELGAGLGEDVQVGVDFRRAR